MCNNWDTQRARERSHAWAFRLELVCNNWDTHFARSAVQLEQRARRKQQDQSALVRGGNPGGLRVRVTRRS